MNVEEYPDDWPLAAIAEIERLEERLEEAEKKLRQFGQVYEDGKGYVFDGQLDGGSA